MYHQGHATTNLLQFLAFNSILNLLYLDSENSYRNMSWHVKF